MVYKLFEKNTAGVGGTTVSEITPNQQWANKLHKSINRTFIKGKVISSFIDDAWCAYLRDVQ